MHGCNGALFYQKSFQDLLLPACECQDVEQEQRQFSLNTKNTVKPHDQDKHRA